MGFAEIDLYFRTFVIGESAVQFSTERVIIGNGSPAQLDVFGMLEVSLAFADKIGIGGRTAANHPATPFLVQADDGGAAVDAAQNIVQGNANTNQQLEIGYKTTGNYGSIQAVEQNVAVRPLSLNPAGGNVGIGISNPTDRLHVNGRVNCTALVQTSDRNAKEHFEPVSAAEVLAKVAALPITRLSFKDLRDGTHLGPTTHDFHAAFGLGNSDTTIAALDLDGVALAAIQGLNQKLERKEAEIAELKQAVSELKDLIKAMNQSSNSTK